MLEKANNDFRESGIYNNLSQFSMVMYSQKKVSTVI
jgi:hypothetical protein